MPPLTLLLASRSPRRRDILRFAGVRFRAVQPRGVSEEPRRGESPRNLVRRLAVEKALSVSRRNPSAWVLGSDTVVALGNRVFGKPRNASEGREMLRLLQGKPHQVWTGAALAGKGGKVVRSAARWTRVFFRRLSAEEISLYLRSNEPYDKAGGYAIQGAARKWIKRWEGDYFTVMGLPLQWVVRQLNLLEGTTDFGRAPKAGSRRRPRKNR